MQRQRIEIKASALLILPLAISLASGCGRILRARDPAIRVAEEFLKLYVIEVDQRKALKLAVGKAQEKLEKEIESLKGAKAPESAKPRVSYEFLRAETRNGHRIVDYDVYIKRDRRGSFRREIEITVSRIGDGWKVADFEFLD